jgi:branched-chain amino acid transport system permease protein
MMPAGALRPAGSGGGVAAGARLFMVLAVAVGLAFPLLTGREDYALYTATSALIYVILATGYNILIGMCGQLAMSHVAFFGIGAYASALLTRDAGVPFPAAMAVAVLLPTLAAFIMARAAVRLSGPYLALVTFAFHSMALTVFINWVDVTNGWGGVSRIPPASLLGWRADTSTGAYYVVLFFALAGVLFATRLKSTRLGRAFFAIRENRLAARGVGINTTATITAAFCISGAYAGVAGSLDAAFVHYIDPTSFGLSRLIDLLIIVIVGGRGSVMGVALAALGFVAALEYLRFLQDWKLMVFGLLLVVLTNVSPNGVGELARKLFRGRT